MAMETKVEIHGREWKQEDIESEISWARFVIWKSAVFPKEGDHANCHICQWKIFKSDDAENGSGYVHREHIWLCNECYAKFIEVSP
ncbi:MAG: hypothetical protein CL798_11080 [Chromatiales bacterium]|jgi:hypothetical protein|nr:hypothetical protein [Chromatiales bacterium]